MGARVFYSSFNLHEAGKNASDVAKDKAQEQQKRLKEPARGAAESGSLDFTIPDLDLSGVDNTWRIALISEVGNIQRDSAIASVTDQTITLSGGTNFDTDAGGVEFILYKPPTATEIVNDPSKRGSGRVGFDEFVDEVFTALSATFPTALADLQYVDGVTQQVMLVNEP
jgi:hypothetical protein